MNVLGHMLNRGAEENQFGYHHRCSRLRLTHLCFADDLLIFAEGSPRSVAGVLSILDQFKQMSGLAINIQKTSLLHSCGRSWTDWNPDRSQTCKASCPVFGGFPLTSKKLSMSDCQPFISIGKVSRSTDLIDLVSESTDKAKLAGWREHWNHSKGEASTGIPCYKGQRRNTYRLLALTLRLLENI